MDSLSENNSQPLNTLFSIRAGLSYISELKDKISAKSMEKNNSLSREKNIRTNIKNNESKIKEAKNLEAKLKTELDQVKNQKAAKEKKLFAVQSEKVVYKKEKVPKSIIKYILLFILGLSLLVMSLIYSQEGFSFITYTIAPAAFFMIGSVFFIAKIILKTLDTNKNNKQTVLNARTENINALNGSISSLNNQIQTLTIQIPEAKNSLPEKLIKYDNERKELDKKLADAQGDTVSIQSQMNNLSDEAKQVYVAIKDSYGTTFHPDNWKHLDRIIYYITTGRADNLKDALSILDQRLNAEMIASEIKASSVMLADEIRQSGNKIAYTLEDCAYSINKAIRDVGTSIIQSNKIVTDRISDSITVQAANVSATERLVSAQQLNNSLQRKANKTSEELLYDYRTINNMVHY